MKKLLIIENRHKTLFWVEIARRLPLTFKIVVQNHEFIVDGEENIILPYYSKKEKTNLQISSQLEKKLVTKRNRLDKERIKHYYSKLSELIDRESPDLVIGESTLSHEIITIDVCKQRKIPYYNLVSSRYPNKKFLIVKNDTLEYVSSSLKSESTPLDSIMAQNITPDYMKISSGRSKSLDDIFVNIKARFLGEKLNTPSVFFKLKQEFNSLCARLAWRYCARGFDLAKFGSEKKLLYACQMQPESNIDVWGVEYKDQFGLVQEILKHAKPDMTVLVKPNPKMKYEMNAKEVISLKRRGAVLVPFGYEMRALFEEISGLVTVTGTVSYEALSVGLPVCLLSNLPLPENREQLNMKVTLYEFIEFMRRDGTKGKAFDIIGFLSSISFDGLIGDGKHNSVAMDETNIQMIADSFNNAVLRN
ncbi:MAG: hypothetical protein ACON5K_11965 [Bacteroidia bacterium]